jgi:hypothetical protein
MMWPPPSPFQCLLWDSPTETHRRGGEDLRLDAGAQALELVHLAVGILELLDQRRDVGRVDVGLLAFFLALLAGLAAILSSRALTAVRVAVGMVVILPAWKERIARDAHERSVQRTLLVACADR